MNPSASTPLLFQPLRLRKLTLKNRIMISPMGMFAAQDGHATAFHLAHYGQYAIGGAGMVMVEATAVERRGRIGHGDMGLWDDAQIAPLKQVADLLRELGSVPAIQLAHSGHKGSSQSPWDGYGPLTEADAARGEPPWGCVAPSAIPYAPGHPLPHALSLEEIGIVLDAWEAAALRARAAGFEVIEIHGAHGYLIHEFLSPLTNFRQDAYGGDIEGRMRFALEVAQRVRRAWPEDRPVLFRASVIDGATQGWNLEDSAQLTRRLQALGIDMLDCSSGGTSGLDRSQALPREPGFQVFLSKGIKARTGALTAAVGLITDARQAEEILQKGEADLIAIARVALYDPYWPLHAALTLGADPGFGLWPPRYGWWLERWARTVAKHPPGEGMLAPVLKAVGN